MNGLLVIFNDDTVIRKSEIIDQITFSSVQEAAPYSALLRELFVFKPDRKSN